MPRTKGRYNYQDDQLGIAKTLGYSTTEEAMASEYNKAQSCIKVADKFGLTQMAVNRRLKALGVKLRKKGFPKRSVKITRDSYIDISFSDDPTIVIAKRHEISPPTVLKIKRGYVPTLI